LATLPEFNYTSLTRYGQESTAMTGKNILEKQGDFYHHHRRLF
jgi:hypothetical protein